MGVGVLSIKENFTGAEGALPLFVEISVVKVANRRRRSANHTEITDRVVGSKAFRRGLFSNAIIRLTSSMVIIIALRFLRVVLATFVSHRAIFAGVALETKVASFNLFNSNAAIKLGDRFRS